MNPEIFDYLSEKLFTTGASDVFLSNIIMKKGRPAIQLNIICENNLADSVKKIIFTESTTLGIRTFPFKKYTLKREFELLDTDLGKVTIKRSYHEGKEVSSKPEFDDCRKIAADTGIPLKEVFRHVNKLLNNSI